jgi:thiol-disulfide isomerase/thioredoxin
MRNMKEKSHHTKLLAFVLAIFTATCHAAPGPGDTPPAVVGMNPDGDWVSLDSYAGKAIVLSFWATWCGPCMNELPILEGVQKTAGQDSLQVIAVNIESREVYRQIARRLSSLSLLVAHDAGKKGSAAYGVGGIPHMVIVGRDGKIIKVHKGYSEKALDGIVADINKALEPSR